VTWEGEQLLLINESGAMFRLGELATRKRYPD
jgi:hypothetical protein